MIGTKGALWVMCIANIKGEVRLRLNASQTLALNWESFAIVLMKELATVNDEADIYFKMSASMRNELIADSCL